jgi:TolB protein
MDLESEKRVRLTRGVCIDTSPSFSPDGRYIVFNSDRAGTQQLYIMDANGANIRRLSFEEGFRYASPVWSPRGDWIAFTKFRGGTFYIGIIRPDGSGERVLASGYLLEGPTWSPNGRVLMHSQQDYSRREKIFSVDITGNNKHEINTPGDAIDPEWSTGTNRLRNSARNSDWF